MRIWHILSATLRSSACAHGVLALALLLCTISLPRLIAQEVIQLTATEQFVINELKNGREVDLSDRAPKEQVLRKDFVEELLNIAYSNPLIQKNGVSISNAIFRDKLNISDTEIPFRLLLLSCTFNHGVDFGNTKFSRRISLANSTFLGTRSAPTPNTIKASACGLNCPNPPEQVNDATEQADDEAFFSGMKVNGSADFSSTTFHVPVDFTSAEIESDLLFDDVRYQVAEPADFESLKTKGAAFFRRDNFAAPLILNDADLFELFVEGICSCSLNLDLTHAHIERKLWIKNIQLNSWTARFLQVNSEITLDRVTPLGEVDLAHSHLQNLAIVGFDKWLHLKPGMLHLEGVSFDTVEIEDDHYPPADKVLPLIDSESSFSPQPYLELEKFYRAHGNPRDADDVYRDMRVHQRPLLSFPSRVWDLLLEITLAYGKQSWRAGLGAIFLLVLGVFVFAPNRMRWTDPNHQQEGRYSRFWYSLDQLAPAINLGDAKNWAPDPNELWTHNYAIFQRIAGWVLIPLILGAITGLIK
jgi:hypothetical protein